MKIKIKVNVIITSFLIFLAMLGVAYSSTRITDTSVNTTESNATTFYENDVSLVKKYIQLGNDTIDTHINNDLITNQANISISNSSYEYWLNDTLTRSYNDTYDAYVDTANTTQEMRDAVNTSLYYLFTSADLQCTNCIGGTEINETTLTGYSTANTTVDNLWIEYLLGKNTTAEIQAVAVGGEIAGTVGTTTLSHTALDDQYIRLGNVTVDTLWSAYILGKNTTEEMQDAVMSAIDDGTQTLITVTYEDATNDMDFVVDSDLHKYSWANVVDSDISDTLTCSIMNLNTATFTSTIHGGNITADSLTGTQIAELTDADISNTLTCSILTDDNTYATVAGETFTGDVTVQGWSNATNTNATKTYTTVTCYNPTCTRNITDNSTNLILYG